MTFQVRFTCIQCQLKVFNVEREFSFLRNGSKFFEACRLTSRVHFDYSNGICNVIKL